MIIAQLAGVINLVIPIIFAYMLFPALFAYQTTLIVCALLLGAWVYTIHRKKSIALKKSLTFAPSDEYKRAIEELIASCAVDPAIIPIRYAYTDNQLAITLFDMIVVDPLAHAQVEQDPEAQKVLSIYQAAIKPTLSALRHDYMAKIKAIFTPGAQRFVIKHELAHVLQKNSEKKLIVMFATSAIAAYLGLVAGLAYVPFHPLLGLIVGVSIFMLSDIALTHAVVRGLFTYYYECAADKFAAQHSATTDIEQAATFFEQLELLTLEYLVSEGKDISNMLPPRFSSGHPSGNERATALRAFIKAKQV